MSESVVAQSKICYKCRGQVDGLATVCLHCRAKLGSANQDGVAKKPGPKVLLYIGAAIALFCAIGAVIDSSNPTPPADNSIQSQVGAAQAKDDCDLFLKRFGKPDTEYSSENEQPRPAIVTRFLTYKKERVRAIYVLENDGKWKLVGFTDPRANKALDPQEAMNRMAKRDSFKK